MKPEDVMQIRLIIDYFQNEFEIKNSMLRNKHADLLVNYMESLLEVNKVIGKIQDKIGKIPLDFDEHKVKKGFFKKIFTFLGKK